ncbi:MAG: hypothetical protein U1F43_10870 [Myxococcota bacterium]
MASREKASDRKATNPRQKAIEPEPPETVTCFMSGRVVPKDEAILVKLGPGQRVWMLPEFCSDRDRERRGGG